METYRVGVIADTHVPEFLPVLPEGLAGLFQGVDLILHAGDITGQDVLDQLKALAPVVAVKGDHDIGYHDNVLLFNPGAVYHLTPERAKAELSQPQPLLRRAYLL